MKIITIFAAACILFFSCATNEKNALIGKWQLTEELIDIGDGKGEFKAVNTQQFIEFMRDGTFTSTVSLCQISANESDTGTGTYSIDENKIIPNKCAGENDRSITFETNGKELILNLECIEPCKQKYLKVD